MTIYETLTTIWDGVLRQIPLIPDLWQPSPPQDGLLLPINGYKELSFFIVWSPKCGTRSIGFHTLKKLLELNPLAKGDGALGFGPGFRCGRRSGQTQVLELCPRERCRWRAGQGMEWAEKARRQARGRAGFLRKSEEQGAWIQELSASWRSLSFWRNLADKDHVPELALWTKGGLSV